MTAFKSGDPLTLNRLYGRSSGHKLRKGQAGLIETLLPAIAVPRTKATRSRSLFGDDRPLHFEIGFGSGEHLAHRADLLPDHGFIGAEPFLNGVATALGHVRDQHLPNVRLWMGDALDVLPRIPDGALTMRLPAPPRSVAQGAPCQAADDQRRPDRPDRGQAEARRRIPLRHRSSGLSRLGADDHAAPRATSSNGG